jgi:cytochrome c oxidase assembly protein subunit 15
MMAEPQIEVTHKAVEASVTTSPRAAAAAWLGVLFCLVFTLNTVGGWVRLSGSGVAIPHWPVIETERGWTLLPPFDNAGWLDMHQAFLAHQAKLQTRIEAGELTAANLGRQPRDLAEFRTMFLTEWSHRLLAAITGLVALAVIVTTMRHRELRRRAGWPLGLAGGLIVFQAVLGGMLVEQGTNTHWLFLHQGNAGLIMASILWAILRLLSSQQQAVPGRSTLGAFTLTAAGAIWLQLIFGALVAGSRPHAVGEPQLWQPARDLAWNLLDNGWLHLALHRWWAWTLTVILIATYLLAMRTPTGLRQRLALQVSGTFLALQLVFGLASAAVGAVPALALGHQALGMCLLLAVVLAWHDCRYEETSAPVVEGVAA